ncbi:hypothetical protein ACFL2Z_04120, partial [Candidatus Eisenbacteria bacterium]
MKNTRFLIFALVIGIGTTILVVPSFEGAVHEIVESPSALFWLALAIAATILPVRGLAGVGTLNISPLPLLTMLLLHGTEMALVGGWIVGLVATVASQTGHLKADAQRALVNSAKHALCLFFAGLVLWGASFAPSALSSGLGRGVFLRLLGAHAVYFAVSTTVLSFALWLRDGRSPLEAWRALFRWGALLSWSTPVGAYLFALFFLRG